MTRRRRTGRLGQLLLGAALIAALPAPAARANVPAIHGFTNHLFWSTSPAIEVPLTVQLEDAAGANVQRVDISWAQLEPREGVFDQTVVGRLDAIINDADALGIRTVLTVAGTPCWASSTPFKVLGGCLAIGAPYWKYSPSDPSTFGAFVAWLTDRYGPKLAGVEVWNEPNSPHAANLVASDPVAGYAALVRAAHAGRTNGVPIIAGALWQSGDDEDVGFMNQLFAVPGFASAVDIWSVHAYAPDADSIKGLVQDRRQKLDGFGSSAPIWVDEFGQSTCIPPSGWRCVSQGDQASFLSSSFAALGDPALGVSGAIAYDFRDDGPNPLSLEQNYGVVTNLFARKQAFDAVSACLNGAC